MLNNFTKTHRMSKTPLLLATTSRVNSLLKVQFVKYGYNFSLEHSQNELTLPTECEEMC